MKVFCRHSLRLLSVLAGCTLLAGTSAAGPGAKTNAQARTARPLVTVDQQTDRDGTVRSLYNIHDQVRTGAPERVAREFLAARHLAPSAPDDELIIERTSSTAGGHHVRFAQTNGGLPVYRGGITVSLTPRGEVTMVVNTTLQGLRVTVPAALLATDDALAIARQAVQADSRPLGVQDAARLMIFRASNGTDHVAYRVTVVRSSGDWEVFVDASTGAVLSTVDQFVHAGPMVRRRGSVYRSDPLSAAHQWYGVPGFTDGNDAATDSLNRYRITVELDSLETSDGTAWLRGSRCEITDIEFPIDSAYGSASPDGFFFNRSQPGFEAVNAYYHTGLAADRLRELGFPWGSTGRLRIDPHGCNGNDDSHYSPTGHWIAFGTGGVDDAEDADVLWHELGHAIQYSLIPGWGGGECGALGEGFADYWAASYSRSLGEWHPSDPQYHWLFNWDGHNAFWSGRVTNDQRSYPFGPLGVHEAGQIWSSALVGILGELGRDVTDRLVLHSFAYLGPGVTATDNAQAIIQADRDLYAGAHIPTLLYWLSTLKGFIPRTGEISILVVNDDPADALPQKSEKGTVDPGHRCSAVAVASAVNQDEYAVRMTSFAALDTSRLSSFSLIVLSGGMNPRPFDDAAKRDALVRYAAGAGRLIVEGGEVGYYFRKELQERDAQFRRNVLHVASFVDDATEADLVCGTGGLFGAPNVLPSTIRFAGQSGFAERDAMTIDPSDAGTFSLGGWSGTPGAAGIVVHLTPERTVNTLFLPFALSSIGDSTVCTALVQNALTYAFSTIPTAIKAEAATVPFGYGLEQNYPNPFNGISNFEIRIAKSAWVTVSVYDVLGRSVATLVNEQKAPGRYTVQFNADGLPSGTYLYCLEVNGTRLVRKMVLMK